MAEDILSEIRKTEEKAEIIRKEANETARQMVAAASADAEKKLSDAEAASREYKVRTLGEITEKAEKLVRSETEEAEYDATKIENHAKRVTPKAVACILETVAGIKAE